ncbi:hypothetical protein [Streptomyces sp. NPDC002599]|uniref:hypothetical protein n=1 Tax=Streptomyces sp. NPDC002599 TaxID=3154421 RepID=UPI00332563A8
MSTLDTCPAADPVGGATPTDAEADPAAARAAMVARLEVEGSLRPGPVRDALLTLPREVLMPQAYVRRALCLDADGGQRAASECGRLSWQLPVARPLHEGATS